MQPQQGDLFCNSESRHSCLAIHSCVPTSLLALHCIPSHYIASHRINTAFLHHTFRDKIFRMPRGGRTELTEILEVFKRAVFVSREVEHRVLEGTGVPVRQDESITVDPVRVCRGVVHDLAPQHVGHWGATHGGAGVAGIGGLDHVGRNGTDCVAAFLIEGFGRHGGDFVVVVVIVFRLDLENGLVVVVVVVVVAIVVAIVGIAASCREEKTGSARSVEVCACWLD
jgi:hypothetical protein